MRIAQQQQWGFLLEQDNIAFFIPAAPKGPFQMMIQSNVQLRNITYVIKSSDHPFYVTPDDVVHPITNDCEYVPEIKKCIVHHLMNNQRQ